MAIERLSEDALADGLRDVPEWTSARDGAAIMREFRFGDFNAAFGFMTRVAMLAEQADHHPEWSNVYNRVLIALTTHDAEGVSDRDLDLAHKIDALI